MCGESQARRNTAVRGEGGEASRKEEGEEEGEEEGGRVK